MEVLVFDLGGTKLRSGLYQRQNQSLSKVNFLPTQNHKSNPGVNGKDLIEHLFKDIQTLGNQTMERTSPQKIGLAFPGPVDEKGVALAAPTIYGDRNNKSLDVKGGIQNIWPEADVKVMNDVTAAGYRYLKNSKENFCVITVSTGIGNKIFIDGKEQLGSRNRGGEMGHIRIDFEKAAPLCDCGEPGHISAFSSGRASDYQVRKLNESDPLKFKESALGKKLKGDIKLVTNNLIIKYFNENDVWVNNLIKKMAKPIGREIGRIHSHLGIERFVIIGGFALNLGEGYRKELVSSAEECAWEKNGDWDTMIELGKLDDNSGLIGAGRYFEHFLNR